MTYTEILLAANSFLILVIGILSSVIAFFLRGLYQELKSLASGVRVLSENTKVNQAVTNSTLEQQGQRLNLLEGVVLNHNSRKAK